MKNVVPLSLISQTLLPPGTRLNDIFEVENMIGEGGMAQVYRARALESDDVIAVKVIKPHISRDQSLMGLLKKEAQTLSKISHEAVVKHILFSVDPGTGRPYLAMELVEGPSLADLIKDGPLSVEAVFVLLNRIGAGLDAAHRLGIIHRDISPENIIIPRSDCGRAKLIDFGIARNPNGTETIIADRFAGKFNYASPEHLGLYGGNITAKSDIYSFGLTLATALIGAPLDLGGTQLEMIRRRQSTLDLGQIDPRFRKILARMLASDPTERPDTNSELLETYATSSGVRVKDAVLPLSSKAGKRIVPAALTLVIVLGLGALAAWYGLMRNAGHEPSRLIEKDRPGDSTPALTSRKVEAPPQLDPPQSEEPPAKNVTSREDLPESAIPNTFPLPQRVEAPTPLPPQNPIVARIDNQIPGGQAPTPNMGAASVQMVSPEHNRRDCNTCPSLVDVSSGTFNMGSTTDASEKPAHPVRIRAFLISRGPVTVGEWNACYTSSRCEFKAEGFPDQLAGNLSWDDAQQYIRWISDITQKAYRLPSEAEWEYAARGGTRTRFWWGEQFRNEMAPCRSVGATPLDAVPTTADMPENPFGLVGTTCAVAQWVSDCWHKNYRNAPSDGSTWNAQNCKQRVLRGGSWRSRAETERVTSRDFYDPAVRYPGNGIRIVRDP